MRWIPGSLRGRLLAAAALFIGLALLATGTAVQFALHRFVQGQIDQRLDGQLITIGAALTAEPDGTVELSRNVDGPPFDNPRTGWFWLIRTPTHSWLSAGARTIDIDLPAVPDGPFRHPVPLTGHGPGGREVRARADHVTVGGRDVVIIAGAPLEALNGPLRDALVPLLTALLVLGTGLITATLLQIRLGLRPLADLRTGIAAVRAGQIERLPAAQPDEIRPLVGELNSLLDQHAANLERARRHVANLAHALKTPLATLTLSLDGRDESDDRLRDLALTMERHIRHHLARARIAALGTSARNSLSVAARLTDHADAFGKIYADKYIRCTQAVPDSLAVACDPQDFDEMAGNLLDNAFKWARSVVTVDATAEGARVRLTISDDGPGVEADQRDLILKRGRRLDESMPGDGFGLAIVQELVELYGGEVALAAQEPSGLRVSITLPAAIG